MKALIGAAAAALAITGCSQKSPNNAKIDTPITAATPVMTAPVPVGDGPFGIPLKGKLADLHVAPDATDMPPGVHILSTVPRPAQDVEAYVVEYHDETGICMIRAVGITNESDDTGSQVRSQIETLTSALNAKYGEPKSLDRCAGGVTCEGQFWTQAVQGGERVYMHEWEPHGSAVSRIDLVARAPSAISTYYVLEYAIGDEKACAKAKNKARSANL